MTCCRHLSFCRDSSVGRALNWRSEGPWFDPGSRQSLFICLFGYIVSSCGSSYWGRLYILCWRVVSGANTQSTFSMQKLDVYQTTGAVYSISETWSAYVYLLCSLCMMSILHHHHIVYVRIMGSKSESKNHHMRCLLLMFAAAEAISPTLYTSAYIDVYLLWKHILCLCL